MPTPTHPNRSTMLSCECTLDERAILDLMKVKAGVDTDANLVRTAIWSLADHLMIPMGRGVFDLRSYGGVRGTPRGSSKRPNPKIDQTRAARPSNANHPWRTANKGITTTLCIKE